MKYLAAYTLLTLGGNKAPTVADIKKLLSEVGIEVDEAAAKNVVETLKGKNLEEVIAEGSKKVQSLSFGGGSSAPAQQQATTAPVKAAEPAQPAPKKEEPKVEPEEDMDVGGFFGEEDY